MDEKCIKSVVLIIENWYYFRKNLDKKRAILIIENWYYSLKNIENICNSIIGTTIENILCITYPDGSIDNIVLQNVNTIGYVIEKIILDTFKKKYPLKFRENINSNTPPDFYIDKKQYEIKTFIKQPGFDIANYESFINQLIVDNGVFNKIFNTKYLIFEYEIKELKIEITHFYFYYIWDLIGYDGKYPISLQSKRNIWYNIRPISHKKWGNKSPTKFITAFLKSIEECPNNITNKKEIIGNIKTQFDNILSKYTFYNF